MILSGLGVILAEHALRDRQRFLLILDGLTKVLTVIAHHRERAEVGALITTTADRQGGVRNDIRIYKRCINSQAVCDPSEQSIFGLCTEQLHLHPF